MFKDVCSIDFVDNFVKKYTAENIDWLRLISNIPYLGKDAIIAGGFPRRIVGNEPLFGSDIDIFFSKTNRALTHAKISAVLQDGYVTGLTALGWYFDNEEYCYVHPEKDFRLALDVKKSVYGMTYPSFILGRNIQLVDKQYCGTVKTIFEGFDIRACQVATDFVSLYYNSEEVLSDIENRHIVPVVSWRPLRVYRVKKFLNMGWTGPTPSYHNLLSRICETFPDRTVIPYSYGDALVVTGAPYTEEALALMLTNPPVKLLEDVVIFEGTNT